MKNAAPVKAMSDLGPYKTVMVKRLWLYFAVVTLRSVERGGCRELCQSLRGEFDRLCRRWLLSTLSSESERLL